MPDQRERSDRAAGTDPLGDEGSTPAEREQLFAAERNVAIVRFAVIALNVAVYVLLMDKAGTIPWLAYTVAVVALAYAPIVVLLEPQRRFGAMLSGTFTTVTDGALIFAWLIGTGGWSSPFYVLWYVSIAAVAFRYDVPDAVAGAAVYTALYAVVATAFGPFPAQLPAFVVRVAYIFFVGGIGALFTQEYRGEIAARRRSEGLADRLEDEIQERQATQDELNTALSLSRATLESTQDGILVVDLEGNIVDHNERFRKMWGIPEEVLAAGDDDRVIRYVLDQLEDPEGFRETIEETRDYRTQVTFDLLEFKDGRVFERYSQPMRVDDEVVGRVWSFRDVTEQRRADEALQASEERFRELYEQAPDGILIVGPDGRVAKANAKAVEIFGYPEDELVGMTVEDLMPTRFREDHVHHRRSYTADPDKRPMGQDLDLYALDADGEEIPVEISLSPLQSGKQRQVMAIVRDIRERKRVEEEAKARARQQAVVADLGHQALAAPDLDDLMHQAVRVVADTLGTDRVMVLEATPDDELLLCAGVGWKDGVVGHATVGTGSASQAGHTFEQDDPVIVEDLREETRFDPPSLLTDHGIVSGISVKIPGADGPWGVLGAHSGSPRAFSEDDARFLETVAHLLAAAIRRRTTEEALKHYALELERSNEELEQFAYVASHDLQEPLRMVRSYVELLEDRYGDELDEDAREFMDFIVDGAGRMQQLIKGLLEYSRIETQGEPFEPTDIDEVLEDVVQDLEVAIEETDADVAWDPMPTVVGDRTQLVQLFGNLIGNALKFAGDEPPRVRVSAEEIDDGWQIAVEDNGIGIGPDQQDRIFVIFQRLHSRDDHPGTGLGLAICKRIVERHGGRIWVDSEPGKGSTFRFTLAAEGGEGPGDVGLPATGEPPEAGREDEEGSETIVERARELI